MALPFEIQIGRISRFLSKWASTKGPSPRVSFGSEITPVLPMWSGTENRFLDSWNRFMTVYAIGAGGAGFNSVGRLRNPAKSGVVAVIEKLAFSNSVAFQPRVEVRAVNTDLTTVSGGTNARLDARGPSASSLILSNQNGAAFALTVNMWLAIISAATGGYVDMIIDDNQELPLLPGDSITFLENGANVSLNAVLAWRERALEESEQS